MSPNLGFKKKFKAVPGVIAGLHTFGARMNFNPHVHMLVTMGGMKKSGEWKVYDYIPFEMLRKQWQTVVLKLIRRSLNEVEKKKVQPLLQKAYSANGEGFYVYAPKQKGNVKEQLAYIGRYIRRPAIALHRIEEYDGQYVTYRYHDKKDGQEKREKLTVEEFMARLIVHIPDEQFKTIRYYGVYSRRIKAICKKVISVWQKEMRKWIVKVKRTISRRKWDQRIKEQTGKDPLLCPHCGNYYEYKGEVCLKEGQLAIKHASCQGARACLERMIYNFTGIKAAQTQQKEEKDPRRQERRRAPESSQLYLFGV
ncbi:MAG: IS91 family transposase [Desulfitobacteriaceae bacterium]